MDDTIDISDTPRPASAPCLLASVCTGCLRLSPAASRRATGVLLPQIQSGPRLPSICCCASDPIGREKLGAPTARVVAAAARWLASFLGARCRAPPQPLSPATAAGKQRRAKPGEGWRRQDPSRARGFGPAAPSPLPRRGAARSGLGPPLACSPGVGRRPPSRSG